MSDDERIGAPDSIRIDRLLVYLRFARTRSLARGIVEGNALRINRRHVERVSETVGVGDVLTLVHGGEVKIVEVLGLPQHRTSPARAKTFYRELTRF
ncbi:S4 domain-containing protein [Erythrobacter sp. THAF29]|uniref:S4 domain-containing protein n=1 Tax=Erythrobacter sp. THAF29 TaxID=2587851 RepID=UPI0012A8DA97|nr:S4 domain-containing protein [Erythrobacter sp. THAF29]QFT76350.1 ribosome-associated heat shock protein Hsp15 [Erythrobacter sp. THAF29]